MLVKLDGEATKRAVVYISGSDATNFLQAQFTSDVEALSPGRAQFTAWCTPKGRVIAVMLLARLAEQEYVIAIPADISEAVVRRLTMYVLRADVTVTASDDPTWGAWDTLPASLDKTPAGTTPETLECWRSGAATVVALADKDRAATRRLALGNLTDLDNVDEDTGGWLEQEIAAGEPTVGLTLTEQFIPQSLNLDALGAVSFEKGCYPGQEIVARTYFLGRLKHRMAIGVGSCAQTPEPGTRLFAPGAGDSASGTVISATRMPGDAGEVMVTAVVAINDITSSLHLGNDQGEVVVFAAPPYKLPPNKRVSRDATADAE